MESGRDVLAADVGGVFVVVLGDAGGVCVYSPAGGALVWSLRGVRVTRRERMRERERERERWANRRDEGRVVRQSF
jgi:hypothetical protein